MTSPLLPLRAAIRALCLADAALADLMGGEMRLYDEPPRGALPLYAVFGDAAVRDRSTSDAGGHEQEAALLVWARPGSAASALLVAERFADLLDDAPLSLTGHHLVHLQVTATETGRDHETHLAFVTLRLRAVTETLD